MSLDTPAVPELSAQQRRCHLMLLLFTPSAPVGLCALSRINRVSPDVSRQDVADVNHEIAHFHALHITSPTPDEYQLEGSLYDRRQCLIHWLRRALRLTPNGVETLFIPRLNTCHGHWDTVYHSRQINTLLTDAERPLQRTFSEHNRQFILHFLHYCHYQHAHCQHQTGTLRTFAPAQQKWLRQKPEYALARQLCRSTFGPLGRERFADECDFITFILSVIKTYCYSPAAPESEQRLMGQIERVIDRVEILTGCHFSQRETLRQRLFAHMGAAIERCLFELKIDNPLLNEIEQLYPGLLSVTRQALKDLEQTYGLRIPEEELCLVAITFGAWLMQEGVVQEK